MPNLINEVVLILLILSIDEKHANEDIEEIK